MSDAAFDPKKLPKEEQVMWEAANVQATVPSGWVKSLLRKAQAGRKKSSSPAFKVGDTVRIKFTGRVGMIHCLRLPNVAEVTFTPRMTGTYTFDALEMVATSKSSVEFRVADWVVVRPEQQWRYRHLSSICIGMTRTASLGGFVEVDFNGTMATVPTADLLLHVPQQSAAQAAPRFTPGQRVRVLDGVDKGKVGTVKCFDNGWAVVGFASGDSRFYPPATLELLKGELPLEVTARLRSVDYDSSIGGYAALTPTVNAKFDLLASTENGSVGGELKLRLPKDKYRDYVGRLGKMLTLRLEETPPAVPSTEPLPCPFCGGCAKRNGMGNVVDCTICHAAAYGTDALAAWNRRAK